MAKYMRDYDSDSKIPINDDVLILPKSGVKYLLIEENFNPNMKTIGLTG